MEIVTANSLAGGRVVFQTAFGWTLHVDEAEILDGKEAVEAALQRANKDAEQNRVVDVYAIAVKREGGNLVPLRLRERIRAEGPTTGHSKDYSRLRSRAA